MDCPNRPPKAKYCYKGNECKKCKSIPNSEELTNMISFLKQESKKPIEIKYKIKKDGIIW